MTKATILAVLRRRLQEDTADNWTDSELHELINEAYFWVQMEFYKLNPDGLVHIDYTTIEAGKSIYPWARGFMYVKELGFLDTSDPLGYRDLGQPRDFWIMRKQPPTVDITWSNLGRHFILFPKPDFTITDGLQKIWVGTLGLANDNDVPELPFNHMSIVVRAQMMAYGETGDSSKELRDELADYMSGMTVIQPAHNEKLVLTGISPRVTL